MRVKFKIKILNKIIPIKMDVDEECIRDYCDISPDEDITIDRHIISNITNMVSGAICDAEMVGEISVII